MNRSKRQTEKNSKNLRRMSKDPIKSELKRLELYNALAHQLYNKPLAMLSLDDLASSMKITKGTFYYYFHNRMHMLFKMWEYRFIELEKAVYPIMENKSISPQKRLISTLRAHIIYNCTHWEMSYVVFNLLDIREFPPAMKAKTTRRGREYNEKFTALVEEVIKENGVGMTLDAKVVAKVLIGFVGSINRWYKGSGEFSAEQIAGLVMDYRLLDMFKAKE